MYMRRNERLLLMKRLTALLLAICISGSLLSGCKSKEKNNTEDTSANTSLVATAGSSESSSKESAEDTSVTTTAETSATTEETQPSDPTEIEAIDAAKAHGLSKEDLGGEYALFLKFRDALEANTTAGENKEFIYLIFPVIAYAADYVDDSFFFQMVSSLNVVTGELSDDINGQYNATNDLTLKTSLFENERDRLPDVYFHELMHFLDYNINGVSSCVYIEDGKHLSPADVAYYTDEQMEKLIACPESWIVTESGAELYTAKFLTGAPYAYKDSVVFLSCIEYIMGEEYMKKLFFSWDSDAILEDLFLEAGYTHEQYLKASAMMNFLARPDLYEYPQDVVSPEDLLIDLYTHYKDGNWKEDKKFLAFIKCFDGVGLEGWRRSKNAEFIGGIVYQSWEQFEPLEKHFVEDIPETPDLEHPYPTIFMRDGNLLFGTQATFTDPSTGEKYKGYITYEWDFENDVRTGYTIKRADEYVNRYF